MNILPKLKICGLTTLADARYCAAAGADYLGFIQYEKSPRYITPKAAGQIIEWIYGAKCVGVFVNASTEAINAAVEEADFAMAQLHGEETPWECAQVQVPVIKAFRVRPDTDLDALRAEMAEYAPYVEAFLLDTYAASAYGGTGHTFDWSMAQTLAHEFPIFLAGGLDTANIKTAIQTVQPFGVDLSSSLEDAPGQKDFDKLGAFFDTFNTLRAALTPNPS